jgi:sugar phosphate isomerase/epimerase
MGSPWGYLPENHTEATFERVVSVVEHLTKTAEQSDSTVAIEGAYAHVVHSPETMKRLLDRIPSKHLRVIVDLFNYLNPFNHLQHVDIFTSCLHLFGDRIQAFHLKDYRVEEGRLVQVGLGEGRMQYDRLIPLIEEFCPQAPLVFEGIQKEDMKRSLQFIRAFQRR